MHGHQDGLETGVRKMEEGVSLLPFIGGYSSTRFSKAVQILLSNFKQRIETVPLSRHEVMLIPRF